MALEKKSKFLLRKAIEESERSTFRIEDIKCGDQVLFEIPYAPGDSTRECWGYVFKKSKSGTLCVVVDTPWISNSVTNIRNRQEYTIHISAVVGLIEEFDFGHRCAIELSVNGVLNDIRVSDGTTKPVTVKLDDGITSTYYLVDHTGPREMIDP